MRVAEIRVVAQQWVELLTAAGFVREVIADMLTLSMVFYYSSI